MNKLTEHEIHKLISRYEPFAAELENGAWQIKINEYQPFVGTAIHTGSNVRKDLLPKILLSKKERYFEEDPLTGEMVDGCPVVIHANDSRYQYDLNREPENCIYEEAWGKKVWKSPLTKEEKQKSLDAHASYYRLLGTLLTALEKRFSHVILYDLHSYNYKRKGEDSPLFNIGTHFIDYTRYGDMVEDLRSRLSAIEINEIVNRVGIDEVFYGKGYQAAFIHEHCPGTLCIPLEIKKAYMDEESGTVFKGIAAQLKEHLQIALQQNSSLFRTKSTG